MNEGDIRAQRGEEGNRCACERIVPCPHRVTVLGEIGDQI
jgi:hypothetical protein